MDNIYVNKKLTMSIIKSIKQTDYTTIITTKSNIVKVYNLFSYYFTCVCIALNFIVCNIIFFYLHIYYPQ